MARITLEDVAEKAGVSFKTVSRVLNNESGVSKSTSEKVKQAINELNYVPNMAARSLSRGKARSIGLALGWPVSSPFIAAVIENSLKESVRHGYSIALFCLDNDVTPNPDKEMSKKIIDACLGRQVDGLILDTKAAEGGELTCQLNSIDIPCLVIHPNKKNLLPKASFVQIDNGWAARQAVSYLISLGHRAIGFVGYDVGIFPDEEREGGYQKAFTDAGLPWKKDWVFGSIADTGFKLGFSGAMRLLSTHKELTAIFAENDEIALGISSAVAQMGLKVPEDISIVGFDDISYASMIVPPLTTVHQPIDEIVQVSVEHIIGKIEGTVTEPIDIVMPTKLIVRETCRPPRRKE